MSQDICKPCRRHGEDVTALAIFRWSRGIRRLLKTTPRPPTCVVSWCAGLVRQRRMLARNGNVQGFLPSKRQQLGSTTAPTRSWREPLLRQVRVGSSAPAEIPAHGRSRYSGQNFDPPRYDWMKEWDLQGKKAAGGARSPGRPKTHRVALLNYSLPSITPSMLIFTVLCRRDSTEISQKITSSLPTRARHADAFARMLIDLDLANK